MVMRVVDNIDAWLASGNVLDACTATSELKRSRPMARLSDVNPVSASDFRLRARRYLPGFLFDYVDGAAND